MRFEEKKHNERTALDSTSLQIILEAAVLEWTGVKLESLERENGGNA